MAWKIEDLFPRCFRPDCPLYDRYKPHSHILPHQTEIFTAQEKYIYWQGGVGAGKTTPMCVFDILMMILVEQNIGIVMRRDLKLLYKSTWKVIKEINDRVKDIGVFAKSDWLTKDHPCKYEDKNQGDYTKIIYPNGSMLHAGQTKNIFEGLGSEFGLFHIDDAYESPETIFVGDETNAGLMARLRLPRVEHCMFNGKVQSMLKGLFSTNPPPGNSWLHKYFGKSPGVRELGGTAYRHIQSKTTDNIYLPKSYVKEIMATHSAEDFQRIIEGKTVIAFGGIPVYKTFRPEKHVSTPAYEPDIPLIRAWDFGYHHPAVIFSHLKKCHMNFNHYITIYEIADMFNCDVWELYDRVDYDTNKMFRNTMPFTLFDCGDKSGYRASDTNKDKRGPIKILQDEYQLKFKYRAMALDSSLEYMRGLLKKNCDCGAPYIQIHRRCEVLIDALKGGYKYPKKRDGSVGDKPYKDKYYDDLADGWRYGAENFMKWGIPRGFDPQDHPAHSGSSFPWSWMEDGAMRVG